MRKIFHNNIGMCGIRLELFEEAAESFTKAIEIDDNYMKALVNRLKCYSKLE
jgi:Tfp pilus assembly protein PilF